MRRKVLRYLRPYRFTFMILVLRSGEIVERGNFAELVRAGGAFASLYRTPVGLNE